MSRAVALVALVALAGCIHDHYECTSDTNCNLGVGGRCELDHHCTQVDASCQTNRRYTPHSEADSGLCFDGRVTPIDPCATGQPPAPPTGCAATVCTTLPSCCATAWSDACVQEAQRRCPIKCDTRIAITATKGATTELWDLRYDGASWTAAPRTDRTTLMAYLAPAPGASTPRLAGFTADGTFVVEDGTHEIDVPLPLDHQYHDASSLDLDRDTRDTAVLSWQDPAANQYAEVIKLDSGNVRDIATVASTRNAWGDYDHDAFPDGVAAFGGRYTFLVSIEDPDYQRDLDGSVSSGFGGGGTPNAPPARSFDWADLDGDHILDLVAFGNSLRVHLGGDRLNDIPLLNIDCDPPTAMAGMCDTTLASFAGAVLPADSGATIIAATSPTRALYRIRVHPGPPPTADINPITLPGGTCPTCPPIIAVVVRDLDGDHKLDIVAIDASLAVFVGLTTVSPGLGQLVQTNPIATTTLDFSAVRTSVSGALR